MIRHPWWVVVPLVLAASALAPASALADRVVSIVIEVDGKPYLGGAAGDSGHPSNAAVWRYLAVRELEPREGVTITPDPADPLKATLRGKIVVDVRYGGKAEVEELRLVRRSPDAGWTVAEDDVERMAKDIGLGDVPPPVAPQAMPPPRAAAFVNMPMFWIVAGGLVVVLLAAIGAVLLWVHGSSRNS
jgi:hypothetical protein